MKLAGAARRRSWRRYPTLRPMIESDSLRRRAKPPNLLLVHHDPVMSEAFFDAVSRAGRCRVERRSSSREALGWLARRRADLVVLDLDLPDRSAIAVMEHIAAHVPVGDHVPVIALTASGDPVTARAALELGAVDVLRGPVDVTDLQLRVLNHLRVAALVSALAEVNRSLQRERDSRRSGRPWRSRHPANGESGSQR